MKIHSSSDSFLTLVGVGPGDPSLLTLAAVKAIKESTVISFPIPKMGEKSIAESIAAEWITQDKRVLPLIFPMVSESQQRKEAWSKAADQLVLAVAQGEKVVFLSQGDVSLFSTSSYLLLEIKLNHPEFSVKLIPGINSFSAAAANALWPLCLQQDQLLVMPTPDEPEVLEELLHDAKKIGRVVVLLKLGKRWRWVRDVLEKMNLLESSVFAEKIGFPEARLFPSSQVVSDEASYFSLLMIRQKWPSVIPG